jgi:hypothetical protein
MFLGDESASRYFADPGGIKLEERTRKSGSDPWRLHGRETSKRCASYPVYAPVNCLHKDGAASSGVTRKHEAALFVQEA